MRTMRRRWRAAGVRALLVCLLVVLALAGTTACDRWDAAWGDGAFASEGAGASGALDPAELPAYDGSPAIAVNGNEPSFDEEDLDGPAERYAALDELGRCVEATAIVGEDTMPTEERESIGMVRPSGWQTTRYDDLVDGRYLYNRCHLVGFQLTGENANERNLITGTRYMNVEGMLPYEDEVASYVHETGNHVLYRVTPIFVGDELVARGVHMEAESVEDGGAGVSFNVYCYNVQPGVAIDYETGESWRAASAPAKGAGQDGAAETTYILNTSSMKFHLPDCPSVDDIRAHNKEEFTGTRDELLDRGYEPCGSCRP